MSKGKKEEVDDMVRKGFNYFLWFVFKLEIYKYTYGVANYITFMPSDVCHSMHVVGCMSSSRRGEGMLGVAN